MFGSKTHTTTTTTTTTGTGTVPPRLDHCGWCLVPGRTRTVRSVPYLLVQQTHGDRSIGHEVDVTRLETTGSCGVYNSGGWYRMFRLSVGIHGGVTGGGIHHSHELFQAQMFRPDIGTPPISWVL
mmetsp:Transcript_63236/g.71594  ORF Transcript_63236/g.71594 Transcript_63236/m.71594 type:complete len:125 (-) Transcript_63236:1159-1533(-)